MDLKNMYVSSIFKQIGQSHSCTASVVHQHSELKPIWKKCNSDLHLIMQFIINLQQVYNSITCAESYYTNLLLQYFSILRVSYTQEFF